MNRVKGKNIKKVLISVFLQGLATRMLPIFYKIFLKILSDAVNELALHFFAKLKIMVIKDIEREDIEFYSKIIGCRPVASVDHFTPETLGTADLVEEIETADGKVVKVD